MSGSHDKQGGVRRQSGQTRLLILTAGLAVADKSKRSRLETM